MPNRLNRLTIAIMIVIAMAVTGSTTFAQDGSGAATPASAGPGLDSAVTWLLTQQADDGGFVGFSGESDPSSTLDALMALAAAEGAGVDPGGAIDRAVAYLESGDVALVYIQTGAGQAAKLTLGLLAAGVSPSGFGNVDPVAVIQNGVDPETGMYGTGVYDHALAVIALTATGDGVPPEAIDAFAATQTENGGWAFDAATDPAMADSNTTATAIQALAVAGMGNSEVVADGLAYLESIWLDGGAAYSTQPDTLPDANSTALVAQAMIAVDQEAASHLNALTTFQNASGAFYYNAADTSDNLYATTGAIPALARATLPIVGLPLDATPVAGLIARHVPLAA